MRRVFFFCTLIVFVVCFSRVLHKRILLREAFEKRETLVEAANDCLERADWNCAEKSIRSLLADSPDDKNLQTHLVGILFEQGRYADCLEMIKGLSFRSADLDFLEEKSKRLLREIEELGIENSRHFRLEFEGRPSKKDIAEVLVVLEIAYDSLCRLFDFYPENIMPVVLYHSESYQGVGPRPEWVAAVFDGKLRIPLDMMRYYEMYRPMLFHELTHAFVRAMSRALVPIWLNEGIAQTVDASRNDLPKPSGSAPSLSMLSLPFVEEKSRETAEKLYWYSLQMTSEMFRRDPSFLTLKKMLESLRRNNLDSLLVKYYGLDSKALWENATR